jgi:transposase-like protein
MMQQSRVRGYPVREISRRLGVSSHSLYKWMELFAEPAPKMSGMDHEAETREAARQDVFAYIEMFCNPKRKYTSNGMLSPVVLEIRQHKLNEQVV